MFLQSIDYYNSDRIDQYKNLFWTNKLFIIVYKYKIKVTILRIAEC